MQINTNITIDEDDIAGAFIVLVAFVFVAFKLISEPTFLTALGIGGGYILASRTTLLNPKAPEAK